MRKLIISILMISIFSICNCFATIAIRPIKLRVVDDETGLPIKGLKVYNILDIETNTFRVFEITDCRTILLGEYETDENGEVEIEKKVVPSSPGWFITCQSIIINTDFTNKTISKKDEVRDLLINKNAPDTCGFIYTPDDRYKFGKFFFGINPDAKNRILESHDRYTTRKSVSYNLPVNSSSYPKYRSFKCGKEEFEFRLQRKVPDPKWEFTMHDGTHPLYSRLGEEIGSVKIRKNGEKYILNLDGNTYVEEWGYTEPKDKYVFNQIKFENITLEKKSWVRDMWRTKDGSYKESYQDVLVGEYNGNKIVMIKCMETERLPDKIYEDRRDYYFIIIFTPEQYEKPGSFPFDRPVESRRTMNFYDQFASPNYGIYKGLFYEDWEE